jgi:RNA-binding protein YlmH
MNKEESMLQKRLVELSRLAYNRGIVVFSDFLNLNELNILHTTPKDMFLSQYKTYGGYDLSERQMAVFLPDALYYEYEYPIQTIEVSPLNKKFSEDLTHRDYLGALMNLGIDRCKIGDIIAEDHKALIFVKEEMAEYVTDNLTQIRHTHVKATIGFQVDYEPRYEELKGTVSSIRLDSVLALAYPLSRSKITSQIEAGKVFVNGKLITSNGYRLKENDIISVRKMGRIAYNGILSETLYDFCTQIYIVLYYESGNS